MSEQKKKYTAQEMREMANLCQDNADCLLTDIEAEGGCTYQPLCKNDVNEYSTTAAMLRQAADAEDELAKLHDELKDAKMTCSTEKCPFDLDTMKDANDGLYNEVKSLKARLAAVMKDFAQFKKDLDDRLTEAYVFAHEITANSSFDKIYGGVRDAVNGIRKELGIDSVARGEASGEIEVK